MKKIALITTNKILAQSLDSAMKSMPNLEFEFFLLLNPGQALLDAEVLEIDVALIDMGLIDVMGNNAKKETICKRQVLFHNFWHLSVHKFWRISFHSLCIYMPGRKNSPWLFI